MVQLICPPSCPHMSFCRCVKSTAHCPFLQIPAPWKPDPGDTGTLGVTGVQGGRGGIREAGVPLVAGIDPDLPRSLGDNLTGTDSSVTASLWQVMHKQRKDFVDMTAHRVMPLTW
jgi:hypothetical protein